MPRCHGDLCPQRFLHHEGRGVVANYVQSKEVTENIFLQVCDCICSIVLLYKELDRISTSRNINVKQTVFGKNLSLIFRNT